MNLRGYALTYNKEYAEFWLQLLTLLTTIGTLVVTVYFTSQLVKNDNRRQAYAERELFAKNLKIQLANALHLDRTTFRLYLYDLIKNNYSRFDLIVSGFHELAVERPNQTISIAEFNSIVTELCNIIDSKR